MLSNFLGPEGSQYLLLGSTSMIIHVLFIVLFASSIVKRITMIYHYKKEW